MGESIQEGALSSILVQEGSIIKENDIIAQIETDKVRSTNKTYGHRSEYDMYFYSFASSERLV